MVFTFFGQVEPVRFFFLFKKKSFWLLYGTAHYAVFILAPTVGFEKEGRLCGFGICYATWFFVELDTFVLFVTDEVLRHQFFVVEIFVKYITF